jgi:hypothetical protein
LILPPMQLTRTRALPMSAARLTGQRPVAAAALMAAVIMIRWKTRPQKFRSPSI